MVLIKNEKSPEFIRQFAPEKRTLKVTVKSVIILCFLVTYLEYAQGKELVNCAFEIKMGVFNGTATESVFEGKKRISELIWDEKQSLYCDFGIKFSMYHLFLSGNFGSVIPNKSGYLEDYDFLIPEMQNASHFSKHDAYLDKHMILSSQLGWLFDLTKQLQVSFLVGVAYQNRKWSAVDGYLQYPLLAGQPWTGNEEKQNIAGTVISYEQAFWYPIIGMDVIFLKTDSLSFGLIGQYYPFVSADTIDSHFLRKKRFYDTMQNGYGGKYGCWGEYQIRTRQNNFSLKIETTYEKILLSNGKISSGSIGLEDGKLIEIEGFSSAMNCKTFNIALSCMCYL